MRITGHESVSLEFTLPNVEAAFRAVARPRQPFIV